MKKKLLTAVLILLLLVALAGGYFWYSSTQPLYEVGSVAEGDVITAPAQTGDPDSWQMGDGIELYHFAAGNGRSVLIIHGGPGIPYTDPWPALASLTNEYQFHYYDQRGSGQSTRPFDTFSGTYVENLTNLEQSLGLGAQISDMERIRQILGEEKLIIIGHSFGAFIASLYAAEFPQHVEAMVLIAPANVLVMPSEGGGLFDEVGKRLPDELQTDYAAFLDDYFDFGNVFSKSESDLVTMNQQFGEFFGAAVELPAVAQGRPGGWMTTALYFSMGSRHDYRPGLQAVEAPVLVIHGANDLQSEAASRIYLDAFPNASFHVIENTGHFPFVDQPEALGTVVTNFLTSLQ
ncbi:MAG: alpha/beta hydrolase [Chloroflexota bacterium]